MGNINKHVYKEAQKNFKGILLKGAYPEVDYKKSDGSDGGFATESYNMIEYSTVWSRYMKMVDARLKGVGIVKGIWQNARSQKFIDQVHNTISNLTAADIEGQTDRFRTWCD